jgi:tetratricopeptide (TPR) repeat protein
VRASQGRLSESYRLHERCLDRYTYTLGPYHHRTGDGYVHVASHYFRQQRFDEALYERTKLLTLSNLLTGRYSALLEKALRILGDYSYFAPENARVKFKMWKVLQELKRTEDARSCSKKALEFHRSIDANDKRPLEEMTDDDFDRDIMFWSR